jgi:hypothetical protein
LLSSLFTMDFTNSISATILMFCSDNVVILVSNFANDDFFCWDSFVVYIVFQSALSIFPQFDVCKAHSFRTYNLCRKCWDTCPEM